MIDVDFLFDGCLKGEIVQFEGEGKGKVIKHKVLHTCIAQTRKLKYGDRGAVPGGIYRARMRTKKRP